jgi:hypothetical protein
VTASSAFAANTTGGVILVVLAGTLVPLPSAQNIGTGITINAANDTFTIAQAGRYYLTYQVNLTATLLLGSRLLINVILTIAAGTTVSLQLFGLLGAATLLGGSAGAAVTIIRLT